MTKHPEHPRSRRPEPARIAVLADFSGPSTSHDICRYSGPCRRDHRASAGGRIHVLTA